MTEPYWETERDLPVDVEGRTLKPHPDCLICGFHDEHGAITLRTALFREPEKYLAIPRCLDIEACRARVTANGEAWPLLERGENPWGDPREPASRPSPDAAPKEAKRVDWI